MSLSFWAGFACLEELSDGRSVNYNCQCVSKEGAPLGTRLQ
jgi:hypothetical protein